MIGIYILSFWYFLGGVIKCDLDKILVDNFNELGLCKKIVWMLLYLYKIIYEYMFILFF